MSRYQLLLAGLLLALTIVPISTADPADAAQPPQAGQSLTEAISLLEKRGLQIIFNSRVVGDDLVVLEPPTESEPRKILLEILAPHGLSLRSGRRGHLIIVRNLEPPRVTGEVRDRQTGRPVAGATIERQDGDHQDPLIRRQTA